MNHLNMQRQMQTILAHYQGGRYAEASQLCRQLRHSAPREANVWGLSGVVTLQLGRPAEAEEQLRMALKLQPKHADSWANLGYALQVQDRLNESITCYEHALALQPKNALGWQNLGLVLQFTGRLTEALGAQDKALSLAPNLAQAHYGRALALQQCYRVNDAITAYDAALAGDPSHHIARSYRLLALNYVGGISREKIYADHAAYGAALGPIKARSFANPPVPGRRLRVAFFSPDLRTHSIAYFLLPLLRHIDPAQMEVYLYHDHFCVDEVSAQFRVHAAVWRNFVGLPADAVERQIRTDAPDLLVDLAGHTGLNRLSLLARKLAPVQLSYLGYPNTTGMRAMNYRLVDAITDPAGQSDSFHTEQLVRFAPTAWAYEPPAVAPVVAAEPPCVANGYVTFGCFNNFIKVSDELLDGWAVLLRAVPNSRLRLKAQGLTEPAVAAFVRTRLQRLGVGDGRIELLDRTPGVADHLALYHGVDVALDTFPYHGTTTTCEALWMGVPVVTLSGDRHAARVGTSLLTAVGHPEWIAGDWADYTRIATQLAGNATRLASIRASLRIELQHSPLLDHAGQSARFSAALRECWSAYCARVAAAA